MKTKQAQQAKPGQAVRVIGGKYDGCILTYLRTDPLTGNPICQHSDYFDGLGVPKVVPYMQKKHAIHSMEYILGMDGFRDGASSKPMNPDHSENDYYNKGYCQGQTSRRAYSVELCFLLALENPNIQFI